MPIPEQLSPGSIPDTTNHEAVPYLESNVHALMMEHAQKVPPHILKEVKAGNRQIYFSSGYKTYGTKSDAEGKLRCDLTREGSKMRRTVRFLSGQYIVQEPATDTVPVIIKTDEGRSKVFYSPREKWLILKEDNPYSRDPDQLYFLYIK